MKPVNSNKRNFSVLSVKCQLWPAALSVAKSSTAVKHTNVSIGFFIDLIVKV